MTINSANVYAGLDIDLTGLWATPAPPAPPGAKPLVAWSDMPSASVDWLHSIKPQLLPPDKLSMDDIALLVAAMQDAVTVLQTTLSIASIEAARNQKIADFQRAQAAQNEAAEKAEEARVAAGNSNIAEWLSTIAMFLTGVLFLVGGIVLGANPFLIAAGVIGLIAATQSLANQSLKQAQLDHPERQQVDISWGGIVQRIQAALIADGAVLRRDSQGNVIDANGRVMSTDEVNAALAKNPLVKVKSEDELARETLATTLIIELGIGITTMACGARGMVVAGKNAADTVQKATRSVHLGIEASKKTWDSLGRGSEVIGAISDATSGASDITLAAYSGIGAKAQLMSDDARAEQQFFEKKMKATMAALRDMQALLKKLVEALNDTYEAMSEQVKQEGESRDTIAHNIIKAN